MLALKIDVVEQRSVKLLNEENVLRKFELQSRRPSVLPSPSNSLPSSSTKILLLDL